MILVDRQINELLASGSTFLQNYKPGNVQNIAYDLRTRAYYAKDRAMKSCELVPGASVYVESMEIIELPANLVGRVLLRNSRIRQGLQLAAPLYQPGHKTRVYFRITNISNSKITLGPEEELASIQFERLDEAPEQLYHGTFQDEMDFRSLGNYEPQLKAEMTELEKKVEDIHHIERDMYGNVINLMIIFIGIFSLINVNVNLATNGASSFEELLIFNLCTIGSVSFMTGVLRTVMEGEKKPPVAIWIACAAAFAVAILIFLLV
ncbi:MAG: hypothetical protein LUC35_05040 [Clostridiales bacterium]|nr:hypothetical protein [Clostridiales bacterium]